MEQPIPVWVSRRWLWPRRYLCKGIVWCTPQQQQVPEGWLLLILTDDRRVFIDARGRTIVYGREFFENEVARMRQEAGQHIPVKGTP